MANRFINVCLPPDLNAALETYATREDRSLSSAVRTVLREHLISAGLYQPQTNPSPALPVVLSGLAGGRA
ncbi:MAG: hypothetical protein VKI83_07715 [Synechococcaceae cyanobacterium]|nr:hypothetical protein [Synechococcaceae cyanobacterium]